MAEFLVALGLVFAIEGLVFAAFPAAMKRAMAEVINAPDGLLRAVGIASAGVGVILIWLMRS
jgi:hypothetical protein